MKKPRILKRHSDSSNPWYDQIRKTVILPGESKESTFYAIRPADYVTILAKTPDDKIIIVNQYRPVVENYTFEFPSGHLERGETPGQAIIRELREETNCLAKEVTLLGEVVPDTGRLENRLWAFYSGDLEVNEFPVPHENEGIEVKLVAQGELFEMINEGTFNHALDLCVVTLAISKRCLTI